MIKNRQTILSRAYIISLVLVLLFAGVIIRLLSIQINEKGKYKDNSKEAIIPAKRGNLFASDGSILATTVTKYDVSIDFKTFFKGTKDSTINGHLTHLCDSLALLFGQQNKQYYLKEFAEQRKTSDKAQYFNLVKDLNYGQVKTLQNLAMFKKRKSNKTGLIIEDHNERLVINNKWSRTIGRVENGRKIGLEGAYTEYLEGKNGREMRIKVKGGWRPLNPNTRVEPQDGYDVVTTIDPAIQDVAYNGLLNQLTYYNAKHGSAIVMEVNTGEVKALVNLTRNEKDGTYHDVQNYAIGTRSETGSTFKLMSLMACLDDGVADTATRVKTGTYTIHGKTVKDSNNGIGYGFATMNTVFEHSSNAGTVHFVYDNYASHPEDFVNRLYKWHLHEKLGLDIQGEAQPYIPHPDKPGWSGLSLPWMAYGYGLEMTPIQVLTFYNAVANNGVMVKPLFLKELRSGGKVVKTYQPTIINPSIASSETVRKAQLMLRGVVTRGTATMLNKEGYSIAGKTGTCQTNYGRGQSLEYIASFCGYFPFEKPRYSIMVTITEPDKSKGYYGASVAGPVFKDIARRIYVNSPERSMAKEPKKVDIEKIALQNSKNTPNAQKLSVMPNLKNKKGSSAIATLENAGLRVNFEGVGNVVQQSIPAGTRIKKGQTVNLILN